MKSFLLITLCFATFLVSCSKKDALIADTLTPGSQKAPVAIVHPLAAGFTLGNSAKNEGSPIQFKNISTSAVTYKWDFGNGKKSTEQDPAFTYASCGFYNVELLATDAFGNTKTFSQQIEVNCIFASPNHPPLF